MENCKVAILTAPEEDETNPKHQQTTYEVVTCSHCGKCLIGILSRFTPHILLNNNANCKQLVGRQFKLPFEV